jgi:hypothetical protein
MEHSMVVTKILVLDEAGAHVEHLKTFCEDNGLVGIRTYSTSIESVMTILKSNVDLGGILLYEHFGAEHGKDGLMLARLIHQSRPELPMFLRREHINSLAELSVEDAAMFRCAFTLRDLHALKQSLEVSIFSRFYPNELVRGISDFTLASLKTLFPHCSIDFETPYLVKDKIIYGEVFTMISLETPWCRGYMMFQANEDDMLALLQCNQEKYGVAASFRELNNVLGELTNLVWGGFKNRYVVPGEMLPITSKTEVPIIINHQRKYISFGSDDPQLCLKFTMKFNDGKRSITAPIFQRFVFNLNWSPEDFREAPTIETFVESGELEFF